MLRRRGWLIGAPFRTLVESPERGTPVAPSAIWALGGVQCVYWGVLYYSFVVLLVPMRADLDASDAMLAGAFSAGLATSALLSGLFGRWLDLGFGGALLRGGALAAAALLLAWSQVETKLGLYAVWIGLGATMAAVLYETAFGLVTRAIADPRGRLNALATVTVMGGLASTLFVPLTARAVEVIGWRGTLRALAVVLLLAAWLAERFAVPALRTTGQAPSIPEPEVRPAAASGSVAAVGVPFVAASFASTALTTLAIPALVDRGHPLATASWVLATLGVMQLPGRLWLWRGGASPGGLLIVPLVLQMAGLLLLGSGPGLESALAGVALFGLGAGLQTLARPWVVPQLYGVAAAGRVNGSIARMQGLARAAGPFVAAAAYGRVGGQVSFFALAGLLLVLSPFALRTASHVVKRQGAGFA